jgi:glycosyltransferase involved in cell wall biosynthesis
LEKILWRPVNNPDLHSRRRLAVVLSHPVQYYSPWFRWISANTDLHLRVFYLWDGGVKPTRDPHFQHTFAWDVDLLSGYEHEFIPNLARNPGTHHFQGLHNPELIPRLKAWGPSSILLFGYAFRSHLGLIAKPPASLIFRGDSHLLGHPSPSWIKRVVLRWIYSRCCAVTYVGQANHDYFRVFGVPESKLHFVPHCVDDSRFTRTPEILAKARELRKKLGLLDKKIILFAGKLVPAKAPAALLNAFFELGESGAALVFVGEGSERSRLETIAATRPDLTVCFLPFANQSEMPSRYAMADIFALPSGGRYETWGLAINEAMHMGVPCLVSDRVGCQQDLVTEGETGWVFSAGNPGALARALHRALASVPAGMRAGIAARISGYTYKKATEGLLRTITSIDA